MNSDCEEETSYQCSNGKTTTFGRHLFTLNESLKMIELIRKCELIWNKNHPEYTHGLSRAVAFEQIASTLNIPGVDHIRYFRSLSNILFQLVDDIRWKWQILRKEYFKKLSINKRFPEGKIRPWKWSAPLSFLDSVFNRSDSNGKQLSRRSNSSSLLASSPNEHPTTLLLNNSDSDATTDNSELLLNAEHLSQFNPNIDQIIDSSFVLDVDDSEPKFFCETIYSPSKEMESDEQEQIINDCQQNPNLNYHNMKRTYENQTIYYEQKKIRRHFVQPTNNLLLDFQSPENNDNNNGYDQNTVLDFLKTQNQILLNKVRKDDLILKQLMEKNSEIIRSRDREAQWFQKQQDPFYAYIVAKLPLLQDIPRSSEWIHQFQIIVDQAFQDIYRKYKNSKNQIKMGNEHNNI